ncbi:MAG: hypothetical protein H6599_05400 [Flavobacteriales bacterium]|nr:hypothetical protein [Flavobacteriales bacterium]
MRFLFFMLFTLTWISLSAQPIKNRSSIINFLKQKVEKGEPLVAHVLVPLCDNEHQGIVPTSASIGNGMDPDHNLYWMTSKGVKRYFRDLSDWKLIESQKNVRDDILERVIFKKRFDNGTVLILVADAYRGDRMHECLNDYFNSLSGHLLDSVLVDSAYLKINGEADLVAFNGHNGLMDESTTYEVATENTKPKDAVSISCASSGFFKDHYWQTSSYPLVHTTNLLYPGAFILEGILNKWAMLESDEECKLAAGKAYYEHKPKSGPNGSQNLFNFGW